ncbi:MAG: hypothetical protein WDA24_01605 [Tissierellales bacterium]
MKCKTILIILMLGILILSGCSPNENSNVPQDQQQENQQEEDDIQPDLVTTPSQANNAEAFLNAAGSDGTWIIIVSNDLTINEDIVLDGEFINNDQPARKIALYEQDENRNVTARYTLTAPRLIVKSENTKIQNGTFIGDIYVEANGFQLIDTKLEGNLYYANNGYKDSSSIEENSSITGNTEIKQP